jgi:Subtilase family
MMEVPPGHVRALLERPSDPVLIDAANQLLRGHDPTETMSSYSLDPERVPSEFTVDPSFGAIPIGQGARRGDGIDLKAFLDPAKSATFLVSGSVRASRDGAPEFLVEKGEKYPVHSNPLVGGLLQDVKPCPPTCGTSQAVGDTSRVRQKLGFQTLQDNGLDGSGVALAIVDSGIFRPRLERALGEALQSARPINLNVNYSWKPPQLVTQPGAHRVGHGTMCAYDAWIMAPNATLLDFPMLLTRPVADHHSTSTADAAMLAYLQLAVLWASGSFDALVVSNSWGIFHPSLEDFPPAHPYRFIDNPNHIFHYLVRALAAAGVDIIFCGNNCGNGTNCAGDCASGTCLSKTNRMIMGANAYREVLTIGGCDTNDQMVGYSSRGPSIHHMFQHKPDLVAYTHFLGSKTVARYVPDTGVSAACPVAAGCVAALRTSNQVKPNAVSPAALFKKLRDTARKPGGGGAGWKPDFGHGIIDPVAAGRALGVIP